MARLGSLLKVNISIQQWQEVPIDNIPYDPVTQVQPVRMELKSEVSLIGITVGEAIKKLTEYVL